MVIITETLLYFCFSILLGSLLLIVIPEEKRPVIQVPKAVILGAIMGIACLSFAPVLRIVLYLYEGIGFGLTLKSVLFTFGIGQAWIFTVLVSIPLFLVVLFYYPYMKNNGSNLAIILTFLLILTLGWASHAASLSPSLGLFAHTTHFLAVSVWIGVLLVVSWWSRDTSNWRSFLSWFHPLGMVCALVTIIAGFVLMYVIDIFEVYTNSWLIPYGQALLVKHILIVPLLTYAFINGFLMKKRLSENPDFNPLPWTRAESVILFFIFVITAALGQQAPPHDLETLLLAEGPSRLFLLFYQGTFDPNMSVVLDVNGISLLLFLLALVFLGLLIISFLRKVSSIFSLVVSALFVITSYVAIMLIVQ